ncbi:MAG: DUF3553 domain-containing protein [Deltaproteobacteria bacterium]|nr:DUF3553 domain-containing protein [Deltaproteobacteria bacterium]
MPQLSQNKRLFLSAGDTVYHERNRAWGEGRVVELMTSTLPGGSAFARVQWTDGRKRVFNNDLDHYQCCYFFGVRLAATPSASRTRPQSLARKLLD